MAWTPARKDAALVAQVESLASKPLAKAMNAKDKAGRAAAIAEVRRDVQTKLADDVPRPRAR